MFDVVIGLGQGGSRIANEFQKMFEIKALFMNFASVDFANFSGIGERFLVETGGTGRDPFLGHLQAKENKEEIFDFLKKNIEKESEICVCVGGGGGSGCGLAVTVLKSLINLKCQIFVIYTLPEKREKLPAKPNSLKILNVLIEKYITTNKISMLLVDNEYSANRYSSGSGFRFSEVNKMLPKIFKRFYNITNMTNNHKYIDFSEGYNSLDANELKKVLYFSRGFTDVRIVNFDLSVWKMEDSELKRMIKKSSLFMDSFNINTSKIALVAISIPDELRGSKNVNDLVNRFFETIGKLTKAPYVFNSSFYDLKATKISISMVLGGLTKSKDLQNLIKEAIKDKETLESKSTIEKLDLSNI